MAARIYRVVVFDRMSLPTGTVPGGGTRITPTPLSLAIRVPGWSEPATISCTTKLPGSSKIGRPLWTSTPGTVPEKHVGAIVNEPVRKVDGKLVGIAIPRRRLGLTTIP